MNNYKDSLHQFKQKVITLANQQEPQWLSSTFSYLWQIRELQQEILLAKELADQDANLEQNDKYIIKNSLTHILGWLTEFSWAISRFVFEYLKQINAYQKIIDQSFNRMVAYWISQDFTQADIKNYVLNTTQQYREQYEIAQQWIKKIKMW